MEVLLTPKSKMTLAKHLEKLLLGISGMFLCSKSQNMNMRKSV